MSILNTARSAARSDIENPEDTQLNMSASAEPLAFRGFGLIADSGDTEVGCSLKNPFNSVRGVDRDSRGVLLKLHRRCTLIC